METTEFFGTEKIRKILFKLAPPVMLAQLIQALYNIVDSFFRRKVFRFGAYVIVHHLSFTASDDCTCGRNGSRN